MDDFTYEDYWKGIILYGLNAATYKMALAKCLLDFSKEQKTVVTWDELTSHYLNTYIERLDITNRPQQANAARLTKMERVVRSLNTGNISMNEAHDYVAEEAFIDVIPRFQTIGTNKMIVADQFYEIDFGKKLTLTDSMLNLGESDTSELFSEIDARWNLLEGAFQISQSQEQLQLANDIRDIYLSNATTRSPLTSCIPFLQGYQGNTCFYCGEKMTGQIHVDHVLPRQVILHDHIWNLVLSHSDCNLSKSDHVVGAHFIQKLHLRNENIMGSNHPWKSKIAQQLGNTALRRQSTLYKHYDNVKDVLGKYYWGGSEGYNPETDPFYRRLITIINNK